MKKLLKYTLVGLTAILLLLPSISAGAEDVDFGDRVGYSQETGMVTFIGTDAGSPISVAGTQRQGMTAEAQAGGILNVYAPLFGEDNPTKNLIKSGFFEGSNGQRTIRYQQTYQGVPVVAGELLVNLDDQGQLVSMAGELSPGIKLSVEPKINAGEAAQIATGVVAKNFGGDASGYTAKEPELWIYDPRLVQPSDRPQSLVWRMEVSGSGGVPVNALVLVDAQFGGVSLMFNQIDTLWSSQNLGTEIAGAAASPPEAPELFSGTVPRQTYTMNNSWDDTLFPGTLLCGSSDPTCTGAGSDTDAVKAHIYAGDTYVFYYDNHSRDSIDGAGMTLVSSVHFGVGYCNAFWDGWYQQMVYGDGCGIAQADDVVGHELTHGVTDYTSGLLYYYQSGAISESLSDVWGEFVDLTNGAGNDDPSVRWLAGEDIVGVGAIRSMSNPPAFLDPDKMTSSYYHTIDSYYESDWDNGGVHTNSGVNNKAVYLMVDGDSFNGQTVTGLGIDKVAAIYYEAQTTLLTSGSNYLALYNAVNQACQNLIGGAEGITAGDCTEVDEALLAVEMNLEPGGDFFKEAGVCPGDSLPVYWFDDDFEGGMGNWITNDTAEYIIFDEWGFPIGSVYIPWQQATGYASSGVNDLWGIDTNTAGILSTRMASAVSLPTTVYPTYLRFNHSFDFEYGGWDGGVLEYRLNGGVWTDANALLADGWGYNGTITVWPSHWVGDRNPFQGNPTFINNSHGYGSSRYDLSAFDGSAIEFRWRVVTDGGYDSYGWDIDDVQIYTCFEAPAAPPTGVTASDGAYNNRVKITWDAVAGASEYEIFRDTSSSGFTAIQIGSVSSTSFDDYAVADLQVYYYWVNACNIAGCSPMSPWESGYADYTASSYLFMDDFETGDFSLWSRVNTGGDWLYPCGQAAINDSWGACVARGDNNKRKQLMDETPLDQTTFHTRFSFDINGLSMGANERFRFMQTKLLTVRPYYMVMRYSGGQYLVQLAVRTDAGTYTKTGWYVLSDAPHTIEVNWMAATGPGANDGWGELYIDDAQMEMVGNLDNDTMYVDTLKIGFTSRLEGKSISGIFFIDDVATSNSDHIGVP